MGMILFWLLAGGLAALGLILMSLRAQQAARTIAGHGEADLAKALYQRQIAELDQQAEEGLMGEAELAAAKAEAGRRLLAATPKAETPERAEPRLARNAILAGGLGAALLALLLYAGLGPLRGLGAPGAADQPYQARVKAWRAAEPGALAPDQLAAVMREIVASHPADPVKAETFLGQAEMSAGDPYAAAGAFHKAALMAPLNQRADLFMAEGEALVAAEQGKIGDKAETAFRAAQAVDPQNPGVRYYVAKATIAKGQVAEGLAEWRALAQTLPAGDKRRNDLQAQIAEVQRLGALPPPVSREQMLAAQASAGDQQDFIRAMVAKLAARLQKDPSDAEGWARLVRSYRVLGDQAAEAKALDDARRALSGRPSDLAQVEAAAK
jgi:cytochrome c-type biogenesis protein CcmH